MKSLRIPGFFIIAAVVAGLYACSPQQENHEPFVCADSTYFCVYNEEMNGYLLQPGYFSTPTWKWYNYYGNQLFKITPQDTMSYTVDESILGESIQTTPLGGIYFLDGYTVYYILPNEVLTYSTDVWAGVSFEWEGNWSGTSFFNETGHYAYVDRDGDGIRVTVRDAGLSVMEMITVPNIPQGDCLAAYQEDGKYSVIHSFIFQGDPYVRRYTFYQSGSTVYLQYDDVQIPEETKEKHWHNFQRDGLGNATFDIYQDELVYHYKISLTGGAYTVLGSGQRSIHGPDGYYTFTHIPASGSTPNIFRVKKYTAAGQELWTCDVQTGQYELWNTVGWADATGVYFVSAYQPETSSMPGMTRMYISADGHICE